jgi:ribosomal peptide maturation radical SAM protein 1
VLKSYLEKSGISADCSHLHFDFALRFGISRYEKIAAGWELGEALYFGLYSPSEAEKILQRTAEKLKRNGQVELAKWANSNLMAEVEQVTLEAIDSLELSRYQIVGLSVGALQLGASVYLAKVIKQRAPFIKIVLGGSSVIGNPGAKLLELVPWLDAVTDGEGETTLAMLAREPVWNSSTLERIPNLHYRCNESLTARTRMPAFLSMREAPPPDMDEYYAAARAAGFPQSEFVMPIEASRGCAWEHRKADGNLHGCTFCGLYRGSPNFREKPLERVMAELKSGVARNAALEVSFVDAYLPPSYAKDLLRWIANVEMDVTLFCEMRCDIDEETAELLARAGARQVQLGVEAFHTRVLGRMAKGMRMIDNVFAIKLCDEYGVAIQYNLIAHFPGVIANELRETLSLLPSLYGLTAPTIANFYLDRGSRIHADPRRYGIRPETLDRDALPFLPDILATAGVCQVVPFEVEEADDVRDCWDDLEEAVAKWQIRHREVGRQGISQLLSYRDTGESLVVLDYREDESLILKLNGTAREVLLACDRLVSKTELRRHLSNLDERSLHSALDRLRAHRLIVEESNSVLGLPVRARLPSGAPRKGYTNV